MPTVRADEDAIVDGKHGDPAEAVETETMRLLARLSAMVDFPSPGMALVMAITRGRSPSMAM